MQYLKVSFRAVVLTISVFLISCEESTTPDNVSNTNTITIIAKWSVLTDSAFTGVGSSNHPINYAGQTGDYFDFRSDGNLYTKEGTRFDTLAYKVLTDNTISIASFGLILNNVPPTSAITNLTSHTARIASPTELTPGGEFKRTVTLSR